MVRAARLSYAEDIISPIPSTTGGTTVQQYNTHNTAINNIHNNEPIQYITNKCRAFNINNNNNTQQPIHNYNTIQQQHTNISPTDMLQRKLYLKQYIVNTLLHGIIVKAIHTVSDTTILHTYNKHRVVKYNSTEHSLQYRSLTSNTMKDTIPIDSIVDCIAAIQYCRQYNIKYDNTLNINNCILLRCKRSTHNAVVIHYIIECIHSCDYNDIMYYMRQLIQYYKTNTIQQYINIQHSNSYNTLSILNCIVNNTTTPIHTPTNTNKRKHVSNNAETELQREYKRIEVLHNVLRKYNRDLETETLYNNKQYMFLYDKLTQLLQQNNALQLQLNKNTNTISHNSTIYNTVTGNIHSPQSIDNMRNTSISNTSIKQNALPVNDPRHAANAVAVKG